MTRLLYKKLYILDIIIDNLFAAIYTRRLALSIFAGLQ